MTFWDRTDYVVQHAPTVLMAGMMVATCLTIVAFLVVELYDFSHPLPPPTILIHIPPPVIAAPLGRSP